MKMLWVPQLSTTINNKFNVTSDSNWRYCSDMIKGFKSVDKDFYVDVVVPYNNLLFDKNHLKECSADNFIYNDVFVHAFAQRFDFNYYNWINMIKDKDYDVIWTNEPALVMNIKSLFGVLNKKPPIIVSYNHWPDNPTSPKTPEFMSYFFRQIEGALYSDIQFVNTQFSKNFIIDGAKPFFKHSIIESLEDILTPAYCPVVEMNPLREKLYNPPRIAYTQRLSDLPYYRKAFDNAIIVMKELYDNDIDFKFRVFNHADKKIPEEYSNLPFIEVVRPKDKKEYYQLLSECYLSLDCYDDERVWSISENEALNLGVMPILKYVDGYKEMYNNDFGGYYNNRKDIAPLITYCLQEHDWVIEQVEKAKKYMIDNFNENVLAEKVLNKIRDKQHEKDL